MQPTYERLRQTVSIDRSPRYLLGASVATNVSNIGEEREASHTTLCLVTTKAICS